MSKLNWQELKKEYLLGSYNSLNDFAEKNSLKVNGNFKTQTKGWSDEKVLKENQKSTKVIEKTIEKITTKEADRAVKILEISDKLMSKIDEAVIQLENYIVTNKKKTKTIEYNNDTKKPSKEVIEEIEIKDIVSGIIDRQGLKFLTAALKDIRDLQPGKGEGDKDKLNELIDALKQGPVPKCK